MDKSKVIAQDPKREKLVELIKDSQICMLTTMDENDTHISRPMTVQQVEFDGDLWFFAYNDSRKVSNIRINHQVGVTFSNKHKSWLSISGQASIINDQEKARELWNPLLRSWFPEGLETHGLTLIKVTATGAEYWDSPSSPITTLLSIGSSLITGEPADMGENERVDL